MLSEDQIPQIKKQLIEQLDATNLPNKEEVKHSIGTMNSEQLEEFLIQNNLIKRDSSGSELPQLKESPQGQQCVFCSIVFGDIPSHKIDENKDSIAVLEINPVSYGHVIVIPKEHISESGKLPSTTLTLAKKLAKKIKTKFKPKSVEMQTSNLFGHEIINVFPIYEYENLDSQRRQAKPEELAELQKKLEVKKRTPVIRKLRVKKITDEKIRIPRRIP